MESTLFDNYFQYTTQPKLVTSSPLNYSGRVNSYFKSFSQHRKYSIFFPIEKVLSFYTIVLIIIGTICNLTSFFIMLKKNIRKYSCMRYLCILCLTDTIVLYQWNLNTFFKYNLSVPPGYKDLEEISLFWCRWISYLAFSSLQLSSWLLSMVSLDRLMIVYLPMWKSFINKKNRVNILIFFIVVTIFSLNMHLLFLNGYTIETYTNIYKNSSNGSYDQSVICYRNKFDPEYIFPKWERAHLIIYNLLPFSIMFFCNSMIIYNIKFARKIQSKTKSGNKKKKRMTYMLILVTFSFMFLTLPSVIVHTFFTEFLSKKSYRRIVNIIVNNLLHTSHSINFFLYVFSAPNFRLEVSKTFEFLWKRFKTIKSDNTGNTFLTSRTTRFKGVRKRASLTKSEASKYVYKETENPENENDNDNSSEEEEDESYRIRKL